MIRRVLAVFLLAVALSVPQQVRADGFGFFGGCCSFYGGSSTWWYGQYSYHNYSSYWYQPTYYSYPTFTSHNDYPTYPTGDNYDHKVGVPEPGTMALLGIGLLGLAYVANRRREQLLD